MYDRAVIHLDLDAFFVSVEVLRNSALKGKPIIIGGSSDRGVVASCSYEARRYGIHAAMPIRTARLRCPDAVVLSGDMEAYSRHSKMVTEVIATEAPIYEKASIDEFYVDATGFDKYFGTWKWSCELRQKIILETGLPISLGLSVNKLVSKVSVNVNKPNAQAIVERGKEQAFLNPLSVRQLPAVGKKTHKKLSFMGVRVIETLAKIPPLYLEREFGKHGITLHKKANAIDDRPVIPYTEAKSISTERTFQQDTIDIHFIKQQLTKMISKLAFELRQKQKLTACITIKLRYTDFNTFTKQKHIPYTSNDKVLLQYAYELFEKLYVRRQLIRLVGIRFSHLVSGNYQIDLFQDSTKEVNLLAAMDKIKRKYGAGAIVPASLL